MRVQPVYEEAYEAAFAVAERSLATHAPGTPTTRDAVPSEVELSEVLYRDWYTRAGALAADDGERDLAELFRAAHGHNDVWEDDWEVVRASPRGQLIVRRRKERRVVHLIDCVAPPGGRLRPRVGDSVSVVSRRDSEAMNPGDWVTFTEAWSASREPVVRLYWNLGAEVAAGLIAELTRRLDGAFPFLVKLPRKASEFARLDAAVLYLPCSAYRPAARQVAAVHAVIAPGLRDGVPPLTLRVAPGLGLAEDPPGADESFGLSRCTLIARAVLASVSRGEHLRRAWRQALESALAEAGVPADRPYVNSPHSPEYAVLAEP